MQCQWLGDRVAVPDLKKVTRNIVLAAEDNTWGSNATSQFPAYGGTGEIWSAIAKRLPADKLSLKSTAPSKLLMQNERLLLWKMATIFAMRNSFRRCR